MKKVLKLPIEIYVSVLFLCFGVFWLVKAYEIKAGYSSNVATSVSFAGPYTFPMIIGWIIICSALITLYQRARKIMRDGVSETTEEVSAQERKADTLRVLGLLIVATIYAIILKIFGFIPTTIVLLFVSLLLFGAKSKFVIFFVSIGAPIILWILFKVLIKVQLP